MTDVVETDLHEIAQLRVFSFFLRYIRLKVDHLLVSVQYVPSIQLMASCLLMTVL